MRRFDSGTFIERLIGTVRREYLDLMLICNAVDLTRKLEAFRDYYNPSRVHRSLDGTPAHRAGASSLPKPEAGTKEVTLVATRRLSHR